MVNVAGRSKGCQTCRRRRVKCDEGRPSCAKCAAARLECEGYAEKGFITVDFSLQHNGGKLRASKPKHSYPARPRKIGTSASQDDDSTKTRASSHVQKEPVVSSFNALTVSKTIPQQIAPSGFMDLICQTFTSKNLLRGIPNPEFLFPVDGVSATNPAALALSNVYFGIRHQDNTTTSLARKRYNKSLLCLSESLQCSNTPKTETLVAVFTLGIYEFVAANQPTGWIWHFMGLQAFFERVGPERVAAEETLQNLLHSAGSMMAMAATIVRKEPIFTKPEWKQAIWAPELCKARWGYFDTRMFEILVHCPRMTSLCDEAFKGRSPDRRFREAVETCEQMQRRLEAWLAEWTPEFSKSCGSRPVWLVPPPVDKETDLPYWDTSLTFSNIVLANQITRYWATMIMVVTLLSQLYTYQAKWQPVSAEIQKERSDIARNSALQICRSVDYHLQDPLQGVGSFMMMFPLRIAHRVFNVGDARRGWIGMVMKTISESKGSWQSARAILDIQSTPPSSDPMV